jgi:hypothetical protein
MSRYWRITLEHYFKDYLDGRIEVGDFCAQYEKYWNFTLPKEDLDKTEYYLLCKLFYTVT